MPIRVLIVDDSALMRQVLSEILNSDPDIFVVDTASDPLIAREKIKKHNPDVLTLDVEMPRMSGLDFLEKIMKLRPMPVIMISSLTQKNTETALKALEIGAFDFVGKPGDYFNAGMDKLSGEIIAKVKAAAKYRPVNYTMTTRPVSHSLPQSSAFHIVAMGASTGGIPPIGNILAAMPANAPPLLIAQHMPEAFTHRFAKRLNDLCDIEVCEAQHGQIVQSGHAYIAPGGKQMRLYKKSGQRVLHITQEDSVNGFCPSVDVLFQSVAQAEGRSALGILLTGMGQDGAKGLLALHKTGATTIGQDEASCVVYGMPRAAFEMGAVSIQLPVSKIADYILGSNPY